MAEAPKSGSLADRMGAKPLETASSTFTPASGAAAWADETATPAVEKPESSVAEAQVDGAAEPLGGSGLYDAQYEVEVKLSDLQNQKDNPLFSIKTFEDLGM